MKNDILLELKSRVLPRRENVDAASIHPRIKQSLQLLRNCKVHGFLEALYKIWIPKTNFLIFSIVLFSNLWIWKALFFNFLIFAFLTLTSFFAYRIVNKPTKIYTEGFLLCFIVLSIFQFSTSSRSSLYKLDNNQQYVQQLKLQQYPPVYVDALGTRFWIPIAHWFEGRKESIIISRVIGNISENLDFNLYFFANHPTERVGVNEFEKFPYILLPFFIIGILSAPHSSSKTFLVSLLVAFSFSGVVGNKNTLGPFLLFPFLIVFITEGITKAYVFLKEKKLSDRAIVLGCLVYFIVILQTISYAIN